MTPISPKSVRYIKLGEAGVWEQDCIAKGVVRLGFASGDPTMAPLVERRDWTAVYRWWLDHGKSPSTATRFSNEARYFVEDAGSTLWITFVGESLWWAMLDPSSSPIAQDDGDSSTRKVRGGWARLDAAGKPLTKDGLAGGLTRLASYRGTSCSVGMADYIVRRINGQLSDEVQRAVVAQAEMETATLDLVRLLGPNDFELLVDLAFAASGWRRLGQVGRTQKTLDLDVQLPTTGERAMVQVKSSTSTAELDYYIEQFNASGVHDRLFFVHHSGEAETNDPRVTVIGPKQIASLTLDAGLYSWVLKKVS